MHSADNAVARCLSVRPSYADVLSKQLRHQTFLTVGPPPTILHFPYYYFPSEYFRGNILTGTSLTGASNARGYEEIAIF